MPRVSIQQFRAALAGRSPGTLARAYRELTRRPDLAKGAVFSDWPVWSQNDSPVVA
jgi:hypothetical protein